MKTIEFRKYWIFFILLGLSQLAFGGNGGSGYSRYGIGDLTYFLSSRSEGMGGAGIGMLSANSINCLNPATWTSISRTRFSIGGIYEGYSSTDGKKSSYLSGTSFNGFMISLPLATRSGFVLGAGIIPYSRINYNIVTSESFDTFTYKIHYIGEGGLSRGYLGLSGMIGADVHLGLQVNYYTGTLNYTTKQLFGNSESMDAEALRVAELSGLGINAGAVYSGLKKFLPENQLLNVGLVISAGSKIKSKEQLFYTYQSAVITSRDTGVSIERNMHIPFAIGSGLSYTVDRYLFASDVYYQQWNSFNIDGATSTGLRNSYRISAGGEYQPKREGSMTYFQRVAYRLGFFYNSSYYKIKNEPLNEIGFTGGLGAPIFGDTRLDINAGFSLRGTTNLGLQKDKIFRLSFTLSGGEVWFERPEQE